MRVRLSSAWATLIVYGLQMVASYLLGRKHYPINYNLRKFFLYFGVALLFYFITYFVNLDPAEMTTRKFFFHNGLILLYVGMVWMIEQPMKKKV